MQLKVFGDIVAQIQALEGTVVSADGLTIGDIVSLSKKLDALKKELDGSKSLSFSPIRPVPYSRSYMARPNSGKQAAIPSASLHKSRITEGNIGRYVIGILASFLILLAVGTAASAFWEYIPNELKYIFFLLLGITCERIGWKQLRKLGTGNGFWTSLTGLGAAISFVSIVLGSVTWYLYPTARAAMSRRSSGNTAGMRRGWRIRYCP
ncbi:MAG: hypothetical protein K2O18_05460, partial [Oscillospiraceae bacterium]|nr:hypothetical protein [Oscillospiraceae bacterium]